MKNSSSQIRVFAPATVANVACGFDVFGFAVDAPGDEVVTRYAKKPGVVITKITGDGGILPKEVSKNTAGVSVLMLLKHLKIEDAGIEIELHKNMPLGSGMGSSAASSVASVVAVNELLGAPLTRRDLLPFVMEGERIACGAAHADNVAPSLLGGFVLIRSYEPLDVTNIPMPAGLYCVLVHPHIEVKTSDARGVLGKNVSMKQAIVQWGNTAGVIAGLMKNDLQLLARSLQDVVVEPVRAALIPQFYEVKDAALAAGALGCSISGSGPSLFALCEDKETAAAVGAAMQLAFKKVTIESDLFISKINDTGARVLLPL